jgi:hypothetical protein
MAHKARKSRKGIFGNHAVDRKVFNSPEFIELLERFDKNRFIVDQLDDVLGEEVWTSLPDHLFEALAEEDERRFFAGEYAKCSSLEEAMLTAELGS